MKLASPEVMARRHAYAYRRHHARSAPPAVQAPEPELSWTERVDQLVVDLTGGTFDKGLAALRDIRTMAELADRYEDLRS